MDEKLNAVKPMETDREIRGETAKLDASESGFNASSKLGIETDDDGRFPMRSGEHANKRIALELLFVSAVDMFSYFG